MNMSMLRKVVDFTLSGRVRLGQSRTLFHFFKGFLFYYDQGLYQYNQNPFCVQIGINAKIVTSPEARIIISNGTNVSIGIRENNMVIPGKYSVKLKMTGSSKLVINGDLVIGKGTRIDIGDNAVLQLDGGLMNGDDYINCNESIHIGKNFLASWRVDIMDTDYHPIFFDADDRSPTTKTAPVIIGEDCWIGHGVTILKGVTINDGAIIGAGSVVTRDVPRHSIVVGNPIRVIRENVYWKL
jgi:acetyltransferase-like isoleucine patch superfamily enzyme